MSEKGPAKLATSFRLTVEAVRLLKALARKMGLSQAGVIEVAVRDLARREKVD